MQRSLIVGFGRAGKELHLRCLRKALACTDNMGKNLFDQHVGVVDPISNQSRIEDPDIQFFTSLNEVSGFDPASTVVHICTPPHLHAETLKQVADLGYTKILMEKPLTNTLAGLELIREIQACYSLDLLVVANWISSSLTTRLNQLIQSNKYGPLLHITAEQNKARLSRTLANPSHETAFDVEIPHLIALALHLGGTDVEVLTAESADMHIGDQIFTHMGKARISLLHRNGLTSELISNLDTPIRKRCIQLYFENHRVIGYYPSGQDDSYSWIQVYKADGSLLEHNVMYDDPLSSVFTEYYRYYEDNEKRPISDFEFNANVVNVICRAKEKCGLMLQKENFDHRVRI